MLDESTSLNIYFIKIICNFLQVGQGTSLSHGVSCTFFFILVFCVFCSNVKCTIEKAFFN